MIPPCMRCFHAYHVELQLIQAPDAYLRELITHTLLSICSTLLKEPSSGTGRIPSLGFNVQSYLDAMIADCAEHLHRPDMRMASICADILCAIEENTPGMTRDTTWYGS